MSVIAEFFALIKGDSSQLQGELDKTKKSLEKAGISMKSFAGIAALSLAATGGAAMKLFDAMKSVADETMKYGLQVGDMARITGDSAESTSMLIQVADDARVSYEQLTTAMRMAVKQGIDPSLEGMMKLADEYNDIQEPIERSKFLLESFGRSGLEMGKMLSMGSDGIAAAAEEAKKLGLAIDQKAVTNARNYYAALDNLGDASTGLKITLGNQLIPVLTRVANNLNENIGFNIEMARQVREVELAHKAGILTLKEYDSFIGNTGFTYDEATRKIKAWNDANLTGSEQARRHFSTWREYADSLNLVRDAAEEAEEKIKELTLGEYLNVDTGIGGKIADQIGALEFFAAGGGVLTEFEGVQTNLFTQGAIGWAEYKENLNLAYIAALKLSLSLGDISVWEAAKQAAETLGIPLQKAYDLVRGTNEELNKINGKSVTGYINIEKTVKVQEIWVPTGFSSNNVWSGQGGGGSATGGGWAAGGYAGGGILVGERGPEIMTKSDHGYIAPNDTAQIKLHPDSIREISKGVADAVMMARA